jgi:hypothetical protein
LSGVVGTDDVSLTGAASGSFANANAGSGKTVTVTGLTLAGADKNNYLLSALNLTANIDKAAPTVTVTGGTFTYDGNSHAASCSRRASEALRFPAPAP